MDFRALAWLRGLAAVFVLVLAGRFGLVLGRASLALAALRLAAPIRFAPLGLAAAAFGFRTGLALREAAGFTFAALVLLREPPLLRTLLALLVGFAMILASGDLPQSPAAF